MDFKHQLSGGKVSYFISFQCTVENASITTDREIKQWIEVHPETQIDDIRVQSLGSNLTATLKHQYLLQIIAT